MHEHPARAHLTDPVTGLLGEPEIAVTARSDRGRTAASSNGVLRNDPARSNSPDLRCDALGEPEVAVRTDGDAFGFAPSGQSRTEERDHTARRDPSDRAR